MKLFNVSMLQNIHFITFYNSLKRVGFLIEKFYFQTVPGTKQYRFIVRLTILLHLLFFRHKKDSGRWSTYKVEEVSALSCILVVCIHFTRPMPRPIPRFILNNIPASRQVCAVVDFSYSALCHALGPRDVRNLYRARATKDRKTSLVASCS